MTTEPTITARIASEHPPEDVSSSISTATSVPVSSLLTNGPTGADDDVVVTITKTVKKTFSLGGEEFKAIEHATSQDFEPKDGEDDFIQDLRIMGWIPRGRNLEPSSAVRNNPPPDAPKTAANPPRPKTGGEAEPTDNTEA
ncbi:hypothetical protein NM688_g2994 [Phlebia brevispora]|uniref:Uncharacterized protein n=1 Tax=Phlebia brevispora TaxID=194682 RepID=A0ACC1T733_9APHY|nr:hypothetical protein NM688_g2994 [Phlebia brevispora]